MFGILIYVIPGIESSSFIHRVWAETHLDQFNDWKFICIGLYPVDYFIASHRDTEFKLTPKKSIFHSINS